MERSSADARRARLQRLIDEHFTSVWRFLRRLGIPAELAKDACQEVFLVAARRIDDVRPENTSERAFLLATAFHVGRDLRRKTLREAPEEVIDEGVDATPSPEEQLDDKRTRELLYRLLAELEHDVRGIFIMYELDGMTMSEIAKTLNLPIGTVGSRLRRAREDFKARFERHRKRLGGSR